MLYWQIKRDFLSLFNRSDITGNHFDPIDGLRAIASLLIICCHIVPIFGIFVKSYPSVQWKEYLNSVAFSLMPLMNSGLEIFFVLSAFLLIHKLIKQWENDKIRQQWFIQQYPILHIFKRALRFWPGILLATIIMFIFGEHRHIINANNNSPHMTYLSIWLFFQNYIDHDRWICGLSPLWTISLDMQIYIILPLLFYVLYSSRNYISVYKSLTILLLLSVVRSVLVFDPVTMPVISSILGYHTLLLVTPTYVCSWLQSNYNITLTFECLESNPLKNFMHTFYFPLEARLGSFIIGAMVAIKISQVSYEPSQSSTWKKFFIFNMILFYSLITVTQRLDSPNLSEFALKFTVATSRTILAMSVAFILFTVLCPPMHPYHAPWIRRFLASRIWIPISKLSYLVYLIHWPITFQLVFGGPLLFLKVYSVSYALIISLPIILFISQIISCVWFLLIEKPFERFVHQHLNVNKSKKIH